MIRPATLFDVNAIITIALVQCYRYPKLKLDKERMRSVLIQTISSARHFCWVSVSHKVVGVIIGLTSTNLWAQRQNCNIVLWVSEIAGDGVKLLQEFKDWIQSRRAIKVAGFAPDTDDIDPRVWKLVQKMGFKRYGGAYLLYN